MVESRVGKHFKAGADGSAFGIVGAVDEARDTCLDNGACTHAAGLNGNVERGISKTVVGQQAGGLAQNDNLCVSRWVVVADGAVAGTGEDLAIVDEHGADRDFASYRCGARFGQGFLHELDVSFHLRRENNMRREQKRNEANAQVLIEGVE